jgi:hypothetical protein
MAGYKAEHRAALCAKAFGRWSSFGCIGATIGFCTSLSAASLIWVRSSSAGELSHIPSRLLGESEF